MIKNTRLHIDHLKQFAFFYCCVTFSILINLVKKKKRKKTTDTLSKVQSVPNKNKLLSAKYYFHWFKRLNGVYPDILTSKTEQQIFLFNMFLFTTFLYKGELFIRAWLAILEICSVLLRHRLHQSMYLYENNVRNYVLLIHLSQSLI